jgi:L-alanine-DL-glutamate epimerase-like enolase superfamily enzyme
VRAYSGAVLGGSFMKISRIVDLHADAGWRVFSFLKIETDAGLIGWSEYNESYGSKGLTVVIMKLAEMLIGQDPRRSSSSPRTSMRARVRRRAALSSRRSRPSRMRSLT